VEYYYINERGEEFYITKKDTYYGPMATIIESYHCNDRKRIITTFSDDKLYDKVVSEWKKLQEVKKDERR